MARKVNTGTQPETEPDQEATRTGVKPIIVTRADRSLYYSILALAGIPKAARDVMYVSLGRFGAIVHRSRNGNVSVPWDLSDSE